MCVLGWGGGVGPVYENFAYIVSEPTMKNGHPFFNKNSLLFDLSNYKPDNKPCIKGLISVGLLF